METKWVSTKYSKYVLLYSLFFVLLWIFDIILSEKNFLQIIDIFVITFGVIFMLNLRDVKIIDENYNISKPFLFKKVNVVTQNMIIINKPLRGLFIMNFGFRKIHYNDYLGIERKIIYISKLPIIEN